jgi:hypothetical protein
VKHHCLIGFGEYTTLLLFLDMVGIVRSVLLQRSLALFRCDLDCRSALSFKMHVDQPDPPIVPGAGKRPYSSLSKQPVCATSTSRTHACSAITLSLFQTSNSVRHISTANNETHIQLLVIGRAQCTPRLSNTDLIAASHQTHRPRATCGLITMRCRHFCASLCVAHHTLSCERGVVHSNSTNSMLRL